MRALRRFDQGRWGDFLALAAGVMLPAAFAPFWFYPLAIASAALLFALWLNASPASAFWRGLLFGIGAFGVGVSWVFVAIHDFGFTGAPVAGLLTVVFIAALALYPAAAGAAAAWLRRRFAVGPLVQAVAVLPAVWVGVEWFRGRFLSGFPWLNLGYSQVDGPLAGWAPVLGVYGVSWAVAVTAGIIIATAWSRDGRAVGAGIAGALVLWGGAWASGSVQWTQPVGDALRVGLVQGNLPQITKWEPEQIQRRLELYADLTLDRLGRSDLIVWPENSITVFYHELADDYFAWLEEEVRDSGTDLVLGLPVMDLETGRYYSSLMRFGAERQVYHKRHLVPFGEFVPLEGMLRGLVGFFDLPMSGFSAGPQDQPPLSVAGQKAAVSICYEDAFGEELIRNLPEATVLINGSNNAWYGDSLAPHQHLQISRMRAVETGRPLLRATTNGISALVDAKGRILARSPQFETYVLNGRVQPMAGATPYVIWGNAALGALLAFVLGGALIAARRGTRRRKRTGRHPGYAEANAGGRKD